MRGGDAIESPGKRRFVWVGRILKGNGTKGGGVTLVRMPRRGQRNRHGRKVLSLLTEAEAHRLMAGKVAEMEVEVDVSERDRQLLDMSYGEFVDAYE